MSLAAARSTPSDRRGSWVVAGAWAFLAAVVLFAVFGGWLTPFDYAQSSLLERNRPPIGLGGDWTHPLGTDRLGRDMVARLLFGTRISLAIAAIGTAMGALLGAALGFLAAHFRGWTEEIIMGAVDIQASMPFIIIALAVLAFFGNSLALFVVLMGLYGWDVYARLTRGAVLAAKGQPYVLSAQALGVDPWRLYLRHVLPNIANVLIVQFTLNFPQTVLLETGLSFLGLGIQPPLTSLGQLLGEGRDSLINAWWVAVIPGTMIFLTALSLSLIGDRLRDRLDPTLGGRR